MINAEKYKDFIENHIKINKCFAIEKDIPKECEEVLCPNCMFSNDGYCDNQILNFYSWLMAEVKEPYEITKKELYLCKFFEKGYLIRDVVGGLFYSTSLPSYNETSYLINKKTCDYLNTNVYGFIFLFVKDKPVAIQDILDNYILSEEK